MKLKEFIENFIQPNSLIRLVYKIKGGHEIVGEDWNDVSMEHAILRQIGKFRHYANNEVIGIASILVTSGRYTESINIVIERLEQQPFLPEAIEDKSTCCCESNG